MIMENYINQLNQFARQIQKPMEEMMQLNIKTLQSFQAFKPENLQKIERPEMIWERQIFALIDSGHKWLDYVEKSYEISERAMLQLLKGLGQMREETKAGKSAFDTAMSNMSQFNPMTAWQNTAKQVLDPSAMEGIDPTQIVREVAEAAGMPQYKKEVSKPEGNGSMSQNKPGKRSERAADKKDKH
ncbi:hypothetical protein B1207_02130 [Legionella quinlivanii]|uniref:Phasin domain-containing protein n=2 Tax=Legionella quinlivanii TaxID=45073 RepID=A0A364LLR5_9GAMM|nr:hypothetical protein B1207_02130 [Legionella quinlivanii]